ncbi:uncharacterized protein LOC121384046 isoform X2 [Gigantopelta aegis]|uniref:uncharacterized protein LOC121384046 isoform X2 n=1 Tax=Gigantopelta aegis TaxID=1735272 RepID=UPI001B88BE8E|nr:uncharacterized protein LOC121384046 isoform X2 [Gigantopelta aegis]
MNTRSVCHIALTIVLLAIKCVGRPFKRECGRVFHFDFENLVSRGGIWQGREGRVAIYKGKAIFQGAGSLIYPFFSHNDLRGGFAFSFKIKPMERSPGVKVAILSNGWEPGTSTLTIFHNGTCLGVRVTEANKQRVRNIELTVPKFKMHTFGAIRVRQETPEWSGFHGAPTPIYSPSNSQAGSTGGDTPAQTISKSRDDRDVTSDKNTAQSLPKQRIDQLYTGDGSTGDTKSQDNSLNDTGDYSNWDYSKYSYGSEPGEEGSGRSGGNARRNTESGSANQTLSGSDGTGNEATVQKTTPRPPLTRITRDSDHDSSEFVEIRKLYKLDPQFLRDRYKSKLETSQGNGTGRKTGVKEPPPSGTDRSRGGSDTSNMDLDEIEVRLSQDGALIRFQVGTSAIQQTPHRQNI